LFGFATRLRLTPAEAGRQQPATFPHERGKGEMRGSGPSRWHNPLRVIKGGRK